MRADNAEFVRDDRGAGCQDPLDEDHDGVLLLLGPQIKAAAQGLLPDDLLADRLQNRFVLLGDIHLFFQDIARAQELGVLLRRRIVGLERRPVLAAFDLLDLLVDRIQDLLLFFLHLGDPLQSLVDLLPRLHLPGVHAAVINIGAVIDPAHGDIDDIGDRLGVVGIDELLHHRIPQALLAHVPAIIAVAGEEEDVVAGLPQEIELLHRIAMLIHGGAVLPGRPTHGHEVGVGIRNRLLHDIQVEPQTLFLRLVFFLHVLGLPGGVFRQERIVVSGAVFGSGLLRALKPPLHKDAVFPGALRGGCRGRLLGALHNELLVDKKALN